MKRSPFEKKARRRLGVVAALAGLVVGAGAGAAYATDAHGTRTVVETGWAMVVDQGEGAALKARGSDVADVGNAVVQAGRVGVAGQTTLERGCPRTSGPGAGDQGDDGPTEPDQPTAEQTPSVDL